MKNFIMCLYFTGLSLAAVSQTVVQGEYFVDTDLGYGNNTLVTFTPSADNSFPLSINVASFQPGYHKLYIRTKDSDGKWSFTTRRNIEVLASEAKTTIISGEYFIDTDPGFNSGIPITIATPDSVILQDFTAVASALSEGYHKLYIRTKNSDGKWSITARRNIEVLGSAAKTSIVGGEYFIDTDPGFGTAVPINITTPDSIILQNFTAVASGLSEGYHKLYGRLVDNQGKWGLTFRRNMEVYKSDTTKVIKAEYFFRTDQGFGECASATFVSPAADGSFSFNIPRNTIPLGADTLFVRVLNDMENKWSFTQWQNGILGPVPLTLLDFAVEKQNTIASVKWQTANEVNTSYFNVQRSTDAVSFVTIGKVGSKLSGGMQNDYTYEDELKNLKAGKIYYRLQMVDNDGRFTYSRISYIVISGDGIHMVIYPNPARNYFVVANYGNTAVTNADIVVRDMAGRMLIKQKLSNATEQRVNTASLSKGMYVVSIATPGHVYTQKLIVE